MERRQYMWEAFIGTVIGLSLVCILQGCSTNQKEELVKSSNPLISFSAQNQLDQQDNAAALLKRDGHVSYDIHYGLKCSKDGKAKSYWWLSQKRADNNFNNEINVSEENCK